MDKNEEYVRSVWDFNGEWNFITALGNYPILLEQWSPEQLAAAAEFAREHKEKVRRLRRQVSLMKEGLTDWAVEILLSDVGGEMSADLMNAEYVRDECTGYFVLALLEAELARLTVGMKLEAL